MNVKRFIPNIISMTSLFLGFLSILNSFIDNYLLACYFILIAAILDSLDGAVARALGVSSEFGKELDSLVDLVSFCLAPSILVYILYSQNMPGISGEVIAFAPLLLGVIRLAQFNVSDGDGISYFKGLPTTFNAIFICSLIIYVDSVRLTNPQYSDPRLLLPIIMASSFLMVTKVRYSKISFSKPDGDKKKSTKLSLSLISIVSFLILVAFNKFELALIIYSSSFVILGLLNHLFIREKIHHKFVKKILK
ncbi:MAG: CDP-diacylglycerol--serine O-phosphatidyltransferase [Candidatus Marinimicrobia bacterium]|nr:CDP-diacylglycerol--serine O-phosphatidyltransferase [Candidatus Neomarinimicrobiota bacterium]|tara:strand:+ start:1780 stop:2529 length:750 start_codon:yes stop_codon:yes gene_type:complete